MSVKELINELSKYPPEMTICLDGTMDNIKVEETSYGVHIFEDLSDWYEEE